VDLELKADAYLVVEVVGTQSLYPVVQQPARDGLLEEAALPYAITNPVFIDVDGNGLFDAPGPGLPLTVPGARDINKTVSLDIFKKLLLR